MADDREPASAPVAATALLLGLPTALVWRQLVLGAGQGSPLGWALGLAVGLGFPAAASLAGGGPRRPRGLGLLLGAQLLALVGGVLALGVPLAGLPRALGEGLAGVDLAAAPDEPAPGDPAPDPAERAPGPAADASAPPAPPSGEERSGAGWFPAPAPLASERLARGTPVTVTVREGGRTISGRVRRDDPEELVLDLPEGQITLARDRLGEVRVLGSEQEHLLALSRERALAGAREEADELFFRAHPELRPDPAPSAAPAAASGLGTGPRGSPAAEEPPEALCAPPREHADWPPAGPPWEVDAEAALAKARAGQGRVLAYVGSEGCPWCQGMARSTWPDPRVVALANEVVFLAVHRHGAAEAGTPLPPEWVVRLGVMGYPQVLLLDAEGRILCDGFPRQPEALALNVRRALREARAPEADAPRAPLPPAVLRGGPDPFRGRRWVERARIWAGLIPGLDAPGLRAGLAWETEPLSRVLLLRALQQRHALDLASLAQALRDPNDYVKRAGLLAVDADLDEAGVRSLEELLQRLEERDAERRPPTRNANNLRIYLIEALGRAARPGSVVLLQRILREHDISSFSCRVAARALLATWRARRDPSAARALLDGLGKGRAGSRPDDDHDPGLLLDREVRAALSEVTGEDLRQAPLDEVRRRARAKLGG